MQGYANQSQNSSAGFVKPTLYNIFSYILSNFLIDAIKPKLEKNMFYFMRDCLGEVSRKRTK